MPDDRRPGTDYVVLTEEPNLMRAHLVAGALEVSGIPTIVDEDNLADEFAMSQKAMGLLRVRVCVPGDRLDEARTIFLAMSQPIPLVDEDDDEYDDETDDEGKAAGEPLSSSATLLVIVVGIALLCGLVFLLQECAADADATSPPGRAPPPPPPPVLHK